MIYNEKKTLKWIKMRILKGYVNIDFLFVFVLKSFSCTMCGYYFLFREVLCWEKHSNLSSFKFHETKIIRSILIGVSFYYWSLTLYSFSDRGKGEVVPFSSRLTIGMMKYLSFWLLLNGYFKMMKYFLSWNHYLLKSLF